MIKIKWRDFHFVSDFIKNNYFFYSTKLNNNKTSKKIKYYKKATKKYHAEERLKLPLDNEFSSNYKNNSTVENFNAIITKEPYILKLKLDNERVNPSNIDLQNNKDKINEEYNSNKNNLASNDFLIPKIFSPAIKNANIKITIETYNFEKLDEIFSFIINENNNCWSKPDFFEYFSFFLMKVSPSESSVFFKNDEKKNYLLKISDDIKHNKIIITSKSSFLSIFLNQLPKSSLECDEIICFLLNILEIFLDRFPDAGPKHLIEIIKNWNELFFGYHINKNFIKNLENCAKKLFKIIRNNLLNINLREKLTLLDCMRSLNIYDDYILDYLLCYCDLNFIKLSCYEIINILLTIQRNNKIIPYELIYRTKIRIKNEIDNFDHKLLIKTIKVFGKGKIHFLENFFEKIYVKIFDKTYFEKYYTSDLIYILYYYSKFYSNERNEILDKIINKIDKNFHEIKSINLVKLLIISLANRNYISSSLLEKIDKKLGIGKIIDQIIKEEDIGDNEEKYFSNILKIFKEKNILLEK